MAEGQARRYNAGKQKWSYLHYKSLDPMLRVLDYGATKYSLYENKNSKKINGLEFKALSEATADFTCALDSDMFFVNENIYSLLFFRP